MKHPTQEQWMEFLYGELPRPRRKELEQHLEACDHCRLQNAEFKGTIGQLDRWKINPSVTTQAQPEWSRVLKWAAAAAFLATTGFATGRFSTAQITPETVEAQIAGPIQERISKEFASKLDVAKVRLQAEFDARVRELAGKAAAESTLTLQQLAAALETLRERDAALYAGLQQVEKQGLANYQKLRADLEKVALFTDESARSAERQFVHLSSLRDNLDAYELHD